MIDSHKPVRTVVFKELNNEKERITVNKVTSLNTIPLELLNKQAGQNMELSSKRSNMERARNQSWEKDLRGGALDKLSEKDKMQDCID